MRDSLSLWVQGTLGIITFVFWGPIIGGLTLSVVFALFSNPLIRCVMSYLFSFLYYLFISLFSGGYVQLMKRS